MTTSVIWKCVSVNLCSSSTCRPLHIAARNGLATVVQVLLSRGAAVMAVDEEGKPQVKRVMSRIVPKWPNPTGMFFHRPHSSFGLCTKQERRGVSGPDPLHHEAFSSQRGQQWHHNTFQFYLKELCYSSQPWVQ